MTYSTDWRRFHPFIPSIRAIKWCTNHLACVTFHLSRIGRNSRYLPIPTKVCTQKFIQPLIVRFEIVN